MPAAASNVNQRRVSRAAQARGRSLSVGRRRTTQACCESTPCRAGCGLSWRMEEYCLGERPLSFGARLWCDTRAAASNAKRTPRVSRSAGAPTLTVSREEAQHSRLLRVRAFPRWLWSARVPQEDTAPARGLSCSASARAAACQVRPETASKCRMSCDAGAIAVSWQEAQHSRFMRVRAFMRWWCSAHAL